MADIFDAVNNQPLLPRMIPSLYGPKGAGKGWADVFTTSEAAIQAANPAYTDTLLAQVAGESELAKQATQRQQDAQKTELEHRIKMLQLTAGPAGELSAVQQIYDLRVKSATTTQQALEAEYSKEEAIAQIEKSKFDSLKRSFESLFDAAFNGARSFWDTVRRLAVAAFLTPVKEALANMLATALTSRSRSGAGWASALAGVGGMFGGGRAFAGGGGGFGTGSTGNPVIFSAAQGGYTDISQLPTQTMDAVSRNVWMNNPTGAGSSTTGASRYAGLLQGAAVMGGMGLAAGGIKNGNAGMTVAGGAMAGYGAANMLGMTGVGGAIFGAGAGLAVAGLQRGGVSGLGMTTAGGELIGFQYGGPIGALIGAAAGFIAGTIRLFIKGATEKLRDKIKSVYGVDVTEKNILSQILAVIKQNYGGNLDVGVRSQPVRDLVELYALSTGKPYTAKSVMQTYSDTESGGALSQNPLGGSYSFSSGIDNLRGTSQTSGTGFTIELDGPATTSLLRGEAVQAMADNPRAVQTVVLRATRQNAGRREMTALSLSPGLVVA